MEPPGCTPKNDVLVGIPSTDSDCAAELAPRSKERDATGGGVLPVRVGRGGRGRIVPAPVRRSDAEP